MSSVIFDIVLRATAEWVCRCSEVWLALMCATTGWGVNWSWVVEV